MSNKTVHTNPAPYIQRGSPAFWRASLALFAGAFVTFANLYSTQAILPLLAKQFDISPAIASVSLSVATGALAFALLLTPGLSDRLGRKSIMLASLALTSLFGFAVTLSDHYLLILLFRALQGLSLAGLASIAMTYVNEEFAPNCRGTAMGLYVSGTAVGGMMGRIITGNLTELYHWTSALQVLAAISLVCTLIFAIALPKSQHFSSRHLSFSLIRKGFTFHLKQPAQFGRFLQGFLLMGGLVTLYNYIGFRLQSPPYQLTESGLSLLFSLYLLGIFSSTWLGSKADHYGHRYVLLLCIVLMLSGSLLSLFPYFSSIVLALGLYTFGFFGAHSIISSWCGQVTNQFKAQASALYLLFYYIGSSVWGVMGGYFWDYWQWTGVASLVTALVFISGVIAWYSRD